MVPSRPQNRIIGEISLLYIWILRGSKMEFPFKMVPFFRRHVNFAGGGVGVIPSQLEPWPKAVAGRPASYWHHHWFASARHVQSDIGYTLNN